MVSLVVWIIGATALFSLIVAWQSWRQHPLAGARSFAFAMAGIAWWLLAMFAAYYVRSSNPMITYLLFRVEAIGAAAMAIYWFRFALEYTGRSEYVTRRLMGGLLVFPALGVPIALGASQFLELYASWLGLPVDLPQWDYWPVYESFGFVYLYVLILAGFALIVGLVLNQRLPRPEVASLWLVATVLPIVVGILYIADVFDPLGGIDPTPLAFLGTGIVGLAAITRYDVFQAAPVARTHVVDRLQAGMVIVDTNGQITDYNEWVASVLGCNQPIGTEIGEWLADRTDYEQPSDGSESSVVDDLDTTELTVHAEEPRQLSVHVSALTRPDGQDYGAVVLLYDVTTQRRFQTELSRQNERLERLASVVSHDLRNPLDVALGQARRLNEELQGAEDDESVPIEQWQQRSDGINSALDHSVSLVDNMVAMTRGGQQLTDTEVVDLIDLAQLSWTYVDTGELAFHTDGSVPASVDRNRIHQLFANLYRNTVIHADATEISVGSTEDGLFVQDDGDGIPVARREEVFQPGRSTHPDGTGLGLPIVKEIVDAHGWSITVTEGPEGGARFEITGIE